jgi:3-oxoacyl-[acyl-carrier-protein] synthase II
MPRSNPVRVLVTGMGLVTALGQNKEENWHNLIQGKTGISLQTIDSISLPLAKIMKAKITDSIPFDFPKTPPRVELWLKQAVAEALNDAQLEIPLPNCGLVIGTSRGYQAELEYSLDCMSRQDRKICNSIFPYLFPGSLSQVIVNQIQTKSIALAPMAACATGNWAIAQGYELIQMGWDLVLVGASDSVLTPLGIAGFRQIGALAKTGLYPFSQEREGLVLGEGAAVLILEAENSWRSRSQFLSNSKVYGEILGFGITNDASHPTSPSRSGAKEAILCCLANSRISASQVDLISAHGTGTLINDRNEAELIQNLFPNRPLTFATKGATGHILGATALIEAAFCLLAISEQQVPLSVGLKTLEFNLNISNESEKIKTETALNFSFGFGGQNAIVALGKYDY